MSAPAKPIRAVNSAMLTMKPSHAHRAIVIEEIGSRRGMTFSSSNL
jgi:hypothetical protein